MPRDGGDAAPAVRCAGLVKRHGDLTAVAGLDLVVRAGECFGLLGPNGAGKTTTVEILDGLTPADAGASRCWGSGGPADRPIGGCASVSASSCRRRSFPRSSRLRKRSGCSRASTGRPRMSRTSWRWWSWARSAGRWGVGFSVVQARTKGLLKRFLATPMNAMQPFVKALPLTALNDALRAVMIDGVALMRVSPSIAIVCAWGLVSFGVAVRIFRWR